MYGRSASRTCGKCITIGINTDRISYHITITITFNVGSNTIANTIAYCIGTIAITNGNTNSIVT